MKIFIAADHAGFELKQRIILFLKELGNEVEDCGAFELNNNDDYPDFVKNAAKRVAETPDSLGLVLGKSGAGECIAANKIRGIRAFLAMNKDNVKLAREHNNANIMSIGTAFLTYEEATDLITIFLNTPFSNEQRHQRRIEKIKELEGGE